MSSKRDWPKRGPQGKISAARESAPGYVADDDPAILVVSYKAWKQDRTVESVWNEIDKQQSNLSRWDR